MRYKTHAESRLMNQKADQVLKSATRLSRRALLIGFFQIGIIVALGARMRFLQVKEAQKYLDSKGIPVRF